MKTITKKISILLAIILFAILAVLAPIGTATACAANLTTDKYTNVLDDLKRDENFDINDYPKSVLNSEIRFMQIAESADGELFVYVYQPGGKSGKQVATSINFSTGEKTLQYKNYYLELVNSYETLYKYVVKGFTVKNDPVRYYDISSIYRSYDKLSDSAPSSGSISEHACPVGQLWTAKTENGSVTYSYVDIEVLEIDSQTVGFLRYPDGFQWSATKSCDAHFFAFTAKHKIDTLLSADLEFWVQDYKTLAGTGTTLYEKRKEAVTLTYDDVVENDGSGIGGHKYVWDRMTNSTEFIKSREAQGYSFKDFEKEELQSYDWVLNFYETNYQNDAGGVDAFLGMSILGIPNLIIQACTTRGSYVTDVTLMRLEFEADGKIYNMGVVSDKQTGGTDPIGGSSKNELSWWEKLLAVLAGVIVLVLIIVFCPWLIQGIIWLVMLPFKGIAALCRAIKNSVSKHKKE